MVTPCWCSPVSDPGSPSGGSSGSNTAAPSGTYYVGVVGDLTGITTIDFTAVWEGGALEPVFSGGGNFTYPHTGEVGLWSGVPDDGTLIITCVVDGVEQELKLQIAFAGGEATWDVFIPTEPVPSTGNTTFLLDNFNGTGEIIDHTPDIGTDGCSWTADVVPPDIPNTLTLTGDGSLYRPSGSDSRARYGPPGFDAIPDLPENIDVECEFYIPKPSGYAEVICGYEHPDLGWMSVGFSAAAYALVEGVPDTTRETIALLAGVEGEPGTSAQVEVAMAPGDHRVRVIANDVGAALYLDGAHIVSLPLPARARFNSAYVGVNGDAQMRFINVRDAADEGFWGGFINTYATR